VPPPSRVAAIGGDRGEADVLGGGEHPADLKSFGVSQLVGVQLREFSISAPAPERLLGPLSDPGEGAVWSDRCGQHRRPVALTGLELPARIDADLHPKEPRWPVGSLARRFEPYILHSEEPDRDPLNTNTALIVNVPLAYTFYALPVVLPKHRTLGLAPVLFGFL
jgi:hypothetical protein